MPSKGGAPRKGASSAREPRAPEPVHIADPSTGEAGFVAPWATTKSAPAPKPKASEAPPSQPKATESRSGATESLSPRATRLPPPRVPARAREKEATPTAPEQPSTALAVQAPATPEVMPPSEPATVGYAHLTAELMEAVCEDMTKGIPMSVAAEALGVNYQGLKDALRRKPDLARQLKMARAKGTKKILTDAEAAARDGRSTHFHQWIAQKVNPKAFSEKLVVEEAENEAPLMDAEVTGTSTPTEATEAKLEHTREELAVIGRALYEHEKKKREAAALAAGKADEDDEEG